MYGESQAEGGSLLNANDPRMPAEFFSTPDKNRKNIKLGGLDIASLLNSGITHSDLNPYLPFHWNE